MALSELQRKDSLVFWSKLWATANSAALRGRCRGHSSNTAFVSSPGKMFSVPTVFFSTSRRQLYATLRLCSLEGNPMTLAATTLKAHFPFVFRRTRTAVLCRHEFVFSAELLQQRSHRLPSCYVDSAHMHIMVPYCKRCDQDNHRPLQCTRSCRRLCGSSGERLSSIGPSFSVCTSCVYRFRGLDAPFQGSSKSVASNVVDNLHGKVGHMAAWARSPVVMYSFVSYGYLILATWRNATSTELFLPIVLCCTTCKPFLAMGCSELFNPDHTASPPHPAGDLFSGTLQYSLCPTRADRNLWTRTLRSLQALALYDFRCANPLVPCLVRFFVPVCRAHRKWDARGPGPSHPWWCLERA